MKLLSFASIAVAFLANNVMAFMEEPMEEPMLNIAETAVAAGAFNTLVAALGAADLVDAVANPNATLTVFAPTDDAFAALPDGLVECLLLEESADALSAILLYHVLGSVVLSTDLMDGLMAETLQGESVTADLSDGVKINQANVVTADIMTSNGVIHVIDAVLVPPSIDAAAFLSTCPGMMEEMEEPTMNIAEIAVAAGSFETLVAALSAADLVEAVIDANATLTVFAPTDDAFASLPGGAGACLLLEENLETLESILLYHVLGSVVKSTDLVDGTQAETLQGESITIDLTDGVKINQATVIQADIMASNGVIHVIDSVLIPSIGDFSIFCPPPEPTMNIAEIAVAAGNFETLVAALSAADLVDAVSDANATLTVFAPTDAAFSALPEGLVSCLLLESNVDVLSAILLYHVLGSVVKSTDLRDGMTAETLQGEEITVDLTDGVKINDSVVSAADVMATNGVIHIIDAVLLPPSIDAAAFLASCPSDNTEAPVVAPTDAPENNTRGSSAANLGNYVIGSGLSAMLAFLTL